MTYNRFAAFTLITFVAVIFGFWFATHQVTAVSPDAIDSYPMLYFCLTMLKCYMTIMALFLFSSVILVYLTNGKLNPLHVAFTFMPLVMSFYVTPFYWITFSVAVLQLLLLVVTLRINDYRRLSEKHLIDFLILTLFFCLHYVFTTRLSPMNWDMALLVADGFTSEEVHVLAPIYRGYLLAKQFSFSYIDHSQWAGVMNPPATLFSPLMQLMTFGLDLPSVSFESFHVVIVAMNFIMAVVGSFGFYLFLRYGAKLSLIFAVFGGYLYFFSGSPHMARMFTSDAGIFLSSYIVFPYALLFISLAFMQRNLLYALWAGLALAGQFFFMSPHPEAVIYSFIFYGLYAMALLFFTKNMSLSEKSKLVISSLVILMALSAFIYVPIVYDRFQGNMYVFAHTGDIARTRLHDFTRYIILFVVTIAVSYAFARKKTESVVFKATLLLASFILALTLFSTSVHLMTMLARKFHIGLHFWFSWRYGMYFCLMVFILSMYALNGVADSLSRYIGRLFPRYFGEVHE